MRDAGRDPGEKCGLRLASLLLVALLAGALLAAGQRASAEDYSDAALEAFVSAAVEVSKRIETWRPIIESAADEDERETLIADAQADLARAIDETEGIDQDEYYAIYNAAREDEALRARIDQLFAARLQRPQVPRAE